MGRWPRLVAPGFPVHITQKGHNGEVAFRDERDFAMYREVLAYASRRTGCEVHAYALMSNHVHLLVTPERATGPSRLLQCIGSNFVRYWNKRHHRSGTLWNGRFWSSIVETERYLLSCSRYIDLNPVKAEIVATPGEYGWSSYRRLGLGEPDEVITPHALYEALGSTPRGRCRAYARFCADAMHDAAIPAIREATRAGTAVGGAPFLSKLSQRLAHPVTRSAHGGLRRDPKRRERSEMGD